jgi:chitinase
VASLTHLNFAFAFLDPVTFAVTTMDPETSAQLFYDAADAKLFNPQLEVWLSIGGWTFSDDGTVTQPIFGNIARSAANRQTFADNMVKFMTTHGYDGMRAAKTLLHIFSNDKQVLTSTGSILALPTEVATLKT